MPIVPQPLGIGLSNYIGRMLPKPFQEPVCSQRPWSRFLSVISMFESIEEKEDWVQSE